MPSCRAQLSLIILCLLSVAANLVAQARGYHMELSEGATGYVILINDSSKTIEAFHLKANCGNQRGGTSLDYDKLWTWGVWAAEARDQNGRSIGPPQPDVVAPGRRMQTLTNLLPQPSGCLWHADIDAVIYSDGTYEGSKDGVLSLQVWRDGFADELRYWSTKVHQQDSKPFDPYAIPGEAKRRADAYMALYRGPNHPFLLDYKLGERQVAGNVALIPTNEPSPDELRNSELDFIDRWQKKLDDDVAFKKMSAIFPPPAEITSAQKLPAAPTTPSLTPLLP